MNIEDSLRDAIHDLLYYMDTVHDATHIQHLQCCTHSAAYFLTNTWLARVQRKESFLDQLCACHYREMLERVRSKRRKLYAWSRERDQLSA